MVVAPLIEIEGAEKFGGKGAALGEALRAGLPVPPGFALDVECAALVAAGDPASSARVVELASALGGPLAVRSSAVGEDGTTASFAGQHATVLGVASPEALLAAVRRVVDSGSSEAARAYRRSRGLDDGGTERPRMGVVVQKMIDADRAGVLFTANPISGADERVIEAAWGLGEIVVAGLVTPDHFRLGRDGAILERTPGEKDLAIRLAPAGDTVEIPVEPDRVMRLCLDDEELRALGALAEACEREAPGPHDIEWAFEAGALYLLQRRPITTQRR